MKENQDKQENNVENLDENSNKKTRAEKRIARKAKYRSMSKKRKVCYWSIRILIVLLIVAAVVAVSSALIIKRMQDVYQNGPSEIASKEEIAPIAPYNSDEVDRVRQMEKYGADDTWCFYVYMCGSNLESQNANELSSLTAHLLSDSAFQIEMERQNSENERLFTFLNELNGKDMEPPSYLYLPESSINVDSSMIGGDSDDSQIQKGCASADIEEMMSVQLPDNVKFIIQTGGTPRWSLDMVNPNRSQIFLYDSNGMYEISDTSIQNMGMGDTLIGFLDFCNEYYPADHTGLIFWNHGGGVSGFCNDDNFANDGITLPEMRSALSSVFKKNEEQPALEFIGFDCCLMASIEVANYMNGYAKYLIASEELEPGQGWDYARWLDAFVKDTSINGAQLGMLIADSYVNYYASMDLELSGSSFGLSQDTTLSVIDVNKASKTYSAYEELAAILLKEAINSPKTLAQISSAAAQSIRYGAEDYAVINTIDFGIFMNALKDSYPKEVEKVLTVLDDSILYRRANLAMSDSSGLSVYFPVDVQNLYALNAYLEFLDTVCENDDIKALYYYKIGGCLNDELQNYVENMGYGSATTLDTTTFKNIGSVSPEINDDGNFILQFPDEMDALIQSYSFNIAKYDEQNNEVLYYGDDSIVRELSNNQVTTEFNGEWLSIGGQPLALEIISSTDSMVKYRSPVYINGQEKYLILRQNKNSSTTSIVGVSSAENNAYAGVADRSGITLKDGDKITPIYRYSSLGSMDSPNETQSKKGKSFKYHNNSKVDMKALSDGTYLSCLTVKDVRGDEYYSAVVEMEIKNNIVKNATLRDDLYSQRMK